MDERSAGSRILLVLDCFQDMVALEAAALLSRNYRAPLRGLFVEDSNLLRVARLPFATEIALSSATTRPIKDAHLERGLRAQADRIQRWLAENAELWHIEWSFVVVQGQPLNEALVASREVDLLVMGRPLSPHGLAASGIDASVVTVFDASPAAVKALETAASLLGEDGSLVILIPNAPHSEWEAARQQAQAWLHERRIGAHILPLESTEPAYLARIVRRHRTRLLVLAQTPDLRVQDKLNRLLAGSGCPLILVTQGAGKD